MNEMVYQRRLIERLEGRFPGCVIFKPNPAELQGAPDLLILYGDTWAMLEVKMDNNSPVQPNQSYYIDMFNAMSFAAFINPRIEEEVLDALQSTFGAAG
jgi:hypothetical protein